MAEARLFRPARILMLGAPGVGKGTFASRLSKSWRLPHISTGDMVRDEIQSGSELGLKFKDYANRGLLIPGSSVNELAKSVGAFGTSAVKLYSHHLSLYKRSRG